jgi:peptide/nickel transport system permease protein
LLRKCFQALFSLWFVITLNFIMIQLYPGNPVQMQVRNDKLTAADQVRLTHEFGLDKPLFQQYLTYLNQTLHGNLGLSFISSRPVADVIGERLPPTLLMVGLATLFASIIGVLMGITTAWRRGTKRDIGISAFAMVFYAMPDFWLGMVLLIFFGATVHLFPVGQYDTAGAGYTGLAHYADVARHMFLPCLTLTVGYLAEYMLIMRSSLIEVMGEDFVNTARAKGLTDKSVRRRHAVPNALLPTVTVVILYFGYVISGVIGVEVVFSYPGIGLLTENAIQSQDFPVQEGLLLILACVIIVFTLITNILYGYIDPRVREA